MFENWVLDATMGVRDGLFVFCPVEGDLRGEHSIMTGLNFVSTKPPSGKVVAVIHEDGQDAVEAFCAAHKDALAALVGEAP